MYSLLLSIYLLVTIIFTIWTILGENEEVKISLLSIFLAVQVLSFIYTAVLILVTKSHCILSIIFYTLSMAALIWMLPFIMCITTKSSFILALMTMAEVLFMLVQVIIIFQKCVVKDSVGSQNDEQETEPGEESEYGVYNVRERGTSTHAKWNSEQSLVI